MGAREIVHRGSRWAGQRLERVTVTAGRAPSPAQPIGARFSLFSQIESWQSAWATRYRIEPESLDRLMQGRIDFFGLPPLDVGNPVDWHRDPQTGIRAPLLFGKDIDYRDDSLVGNVKLVWELGRHQHLVPLAVAYAVTGERRYRNAVAGQIDGWIRDNPYGLGIHWCSTLELALRLISWSVVHSLIALRDGPIGLFNAVASSEQLGLSIYRQARFIRNHLSLYSSANNHLIGELTGLWTACRIFNMGAEGECWGSQAKAELEREARLQIHEDGVDKEQAFYYHLWVLEYLFFAWLVGERTGEPFSFEFRERIEAMAQFLCDVAPEGGQPPQVGDSDDGFVMRFESVWPQMAYGDVIAAVNSTLDGESMNSGMNFPQKAFWYSMMLGKLPTENKQDKKQAPYPRIYHSGGYAVLGAGSTHLVFDAGPLGYPSIAAHGHADTLNFCLALDGDWWLVDPGTYAYHSEHGWRDYFRGTAAHNTLQVDGADQSEIGGPFLWVRHALGRLVDVGTDPEGMQWATGWHDGYKRRGATHTRRIELSAQGDIVTISDEVGGNGEHEMAIHFHFAPDIELTPGPQPACWQAFKPGSSRRVLLEVDNTWRWGVLRGSESPKLGWYSPSLGVKVPVFTLRGTRRVRLPVQVVTRIVVQ
jgi:hypothetical protein